MNEVGVIVRKLDQDLYLAAKGGCDEAYPDIVVIFNRVVRPVSSASRAAASVQTVLDINRQLIGR
jgi:hypothetical protein